MSDAGRIAIVGMSCRFPGAPDVRSFWRLLRDGVEAIRRFTPAELAAAGVDEATRRRSDYVPACAALDGIEEFDAAFFSVPPREAEIMDPQHRVFLELAWEALEDAGCDAERYDGRIGVYAGAGLSTYLLNHLLPSPEALEHATPLQVLMANNKDFVPTRVSYRLNLRGPSLNINTACSTSLVAVHVAAQALLNRECDMALAGGIGIQVPQDQGYVYEPAGILSPDGRCRAFSAAAAGTVHGNGGGIVVLKRLEDAQADRDCVRAVILGTSVNNDGGAKAGYTAPSLDGQASVIAEALAVADVPPADITYVEAHGTGTPVGDPIEVQALAKVFRTDADRRQPCAIGSVKTNFGHLDEGAGVAGLIKAVLALEHRQIPPTLHFDAPNPECHFEATPFFVNTSLREWAADDGRLRRAGVSSFGIGGTNAHVVLEEAPPRPRGMSRARVHILPLSARSPAALAATGRALAARLAESQPDLDLADVAYTLQAGRRSLSHRAAVVCRTKDDAIAQLRAIDRVDRGSARLDPDAGAVALAREWEAGAPVSWGDVQEEGARRVPLPTYPFERRRYWIEPPRRGRRAEAPPAARQPVETWLYEPQWKAAPPAIGRASTPGDIVVFAPAISAGGWVDGVTRALSAHGSEIITVTPADAYRRRDANRFDVRPDEAGDYETLFADLVRDRGALPGHFVHLWLVTGSDPIGEETLLQRGFDSLLGLAQALGARQESQRITLAVAGDGGQAVGKVEPVSPEKAAVAGLLRAIAVEHPSWVCRLVDVTPEGPRDGRVLDAVVADLVDASPVDSIVAHRDDQRLIPAIHPIGPGIDAERSRATIRDGGVYLITGGMGSMGLAIAEWMASRARVTVVLTSHDRSSPLALSSSISETTARRPFEEASVGALNRLCGRLLLEYIVSAGFDLTAGVRSNEATVREKLGITPAYRKMFDWCLDVLAEDGAIERRDGLLHGRWDGSGPTATELLETIKTDVPELTGLAELLVHCARHYPAVLSGRLTGTEVIYPDGTSRFLDEHAVRIGEYSSDRIYVDALARDIAAAATRASGRPLSVLEVGGGAGTLTEATFRYLGGSASIDYTFTDISRAFVTRAEAGARERGLSMAFRVLDISRSPEDQGFAPHAYDVVAAYNVVHATRDVRETLGHLRRLLTPGGRLCLVETVRTSRWDQMIWGLTTGWLIYDDGVRVGSPLLDLGRWQTVTAEAGYDAVETWPAAGPARHDCDAGVIVARAPAAARSASQADRIAAIERGGSRVQIAPVDIANREAVASLVADVRSRYGPITGVIHAAGVPGRGLIRDKSIAEARRVLAPKLAGARALEAALGDLPPEFFVLCSSMASRFPVAGQAEYAAANAALDAFAHAYGRRTGSRAIAIEWGFWQELGMIEKTTMSGSDQARIAEDIRLRGWTTAGIEAFEAVLRTSHGAEVIVWPHGLPDAPGASSGNPWLCDRQDGPGYTSYRVRWDQRTRWITDEHRVGHQSVLPGTAYLEFVRATWAARHAAGRVELRQTVFLHPYVVESGTPRELRVVLQECDGGADFIVISRVADDEWQVHARGEVAPLADTDREPTVAASGSLDAVPDLLQQRMSGFGPHWDNLRAIRFEGDAATALLRLDAAFAEETDAFWLHPALLDNATGYLPIHRHAAPRLPFSYESVKVHAPLVGSIVSRAAARGEPGTSLESFDIVISDEAGRVLVEVRGYRLRPVPRALADQAGDGRNAALQLASRGSLDGLVFTEVSREDVADDEVEIRIEAAGLNFIEVLYALGMLPDPLRGAFPFGLEGTGMVTRIGSKVTSVGVGQRVAVFANGAARLFMNASERCVAALPADLSFEDAATIPAAYVTAYSALIDRGGLQPGERVLIHSACGGVGLAAVSVARWRGADVLATAGTEEKRAHLRSIGIAHVMDSHSTSFARDTLAATGGEGVDVVLNSLSGEFIELGLSVLKGDGRFLELGKRDILEGKPLSLRHFSRRLSFIAIDVGPAMRQFPRVWEEVWRCVRSGDFPPLPRRVVPAVDAAVAFADMARGRHIGKFVLSLADRAAIRAQAAASARAAARGLPLADILGLTTASDARPSAAAPTTRTVVEPAPLGNDIERTIAGIWEDLLGVAPIGRDDDFFSLNGDSLLGAQVIARIHRMFGAKIPLSAIFDEPTIAKLAARVGRAMAASAPPAPLGSNEEEGLI